MPTRARMNNAFAQSGAYVGGTGTVAGPVPNVSGTGTENPYRTGRNFGFMPATTGYLLGLVAAEIVALVMLRRAFRSAHGG